MVALLFYHRNHNSIPLRRRNGLGIPGVRVADHAHPRMVVSQHALQALRGFARPVRDDDLPGVLGVADADPARS